MKNKTLRQLIESLNGKGMTIYAISKATGVAFSALYKIARGEQDELNYSSGKLIFDLDCATQAKAKK